MIKAVCTIFSSSLSPIVLTHSQMREEEREGGRKRLSRYCFSQSAFMLSGEQIPPSLPPYSLPLTALA